MNLRKILVPLCALLMCSCIKDGDNDQCLQGKYLYFQTIMPKYTYENIVDRLEVLVYDMNYEVVYNELYSSSELALNNYRAFIPEQAPGEYYFVTLVNFQEDYNTQGKESLRTLNASLLPQSGDTVKIVQADSYHAKAVLSFEGRVTSSEIPCDTMDLSKNTNRVNVTVRLFDQELPEGYDIDINISGNNGTYDYFQDRCSPNSMRIYMPVAFSRSVWSDPFCFSTMRLAANDDLTVNMKVTGPNGDITNETVSLSAQLAKVENIYGEKLYDTDEKLELEDEFDIILNLDRNYVVASIEINGWVIKIQDDIQV